MSVARDLAQAAAWLHEADGLVVAAGAGMGIDSGLPDFRGPGGFWAVYPALGRARIPFEAIANPAAFARDPRLAWGFYGHRLDLYRRTVPHAGFALLLGMAARMRHGAFVLTSNVDGQFQKAGFPAGRVCEIHGSIHHRNAPPVAATQSGRPMRSRPWWKPTPAGSPANCRTARAAGDSPAPTS